jgi:hypothetical protein
MSLLGVKRTSPFAAHMSAFDPKRTLMLQTHLWECSLSVCSLATIRCPILTVRDDDEAARVHHASQLRGGDLAARSPRAAARAYASASSWPQPQTMRNFRPGLGRSCRRSIGRNMQIDTRWAQA